MSADDPLDELSDSVLRGDQVDWDRPDTGTGLDPDTFRNLRDVARIADFSRRLQRTTAAPPSGAPEPWGDLLLLEPLGTGARGEVWRACAIGPSSRCTGSASAGAAPACGWSACRVSP